MVLAVVGVEAYVVRTRALFFPLSGMDGGMRGPPRAHPGSAVATASGRTARLYCPGTTPSATRGRFATRGGVWREGAKPATAAPAHEAAGSRRSRIMGRTASGSSRS